MKIVELVKLVKLVDLVGSLILNNPFLWDFSFMLS